MKIKSALAPLFVCFKPPISFLIGCATTLYCGLGLLGVLDGWIHPNDWITRVAGIFLIGTALGSIWNLLSRGHK